MIRPVKLLVVVVALMAISGGTALAQKYAFIDSEKIKQNYKEWARAEDQFNTEMKAWEDEAGRMERELREAVDEYEKQRLILSAEKKAEKEAAINAKDQALASFTKEISGPGGRAESRWMELVKPLYEKIQAGIEKLAIEENYDMVFNTAGLAYAKENLDVTDKIIEILESED
jgi:outer membrane protein